jgi:hypothetical protein
VIEIWTKGGTFPSTTIDRLHARLISKDPSSSTTANYDPPRPVMSPALPPLEGTTPGANAVQGDYASSFSNAGQRMFSCLHLRQILLDHPRRDGGPTLQGGRNVKILTIDAQTREEDKATAFYRLACISCATSSLYSKLGVGIASISIPAASAALLLRLTAVCESWERGQRETRGYFPDVVKEVGKFASSVSYFRLLAVP